MSASDSIPAGAGPPTAMRCSTFVSRSRIAANIGACSQSTYTVCASLWLTTYSASSGVSR